jgi:hypothetical protein
MARLSFGRAQPSLALQRSQFCSCTLRARLGATYAFLAGLLFGAGLLLSRMANPNNVLAFLDFAGEWDPALVLRWRAPLRLRYRRSLTRAEPDALCAGRRLSCRIATAWIRLRYPNPTLSNWNALFRLGLHAGTTREPRRRGDLYVSPTEVESALRIRDTGKQPLPRVSRGCR